MSRIRSSLCFAAGSEANFGFDKDIGKLMILPLFDLKFLRRIRGKWCRNFRSAALGWPDNMA
jgi:hypothetical protein